MEKALYVKTGSQGAKLTLLALASYAREEAGSEAFPSIATLARLCEMSPRTVARALDELIAADLVEREHQFNKSGGQTSSRYRLKRLDDPSVKLADTPPVNLSYPPMTNCHTPLSNCHTPPVKLADESVKESVKDLKDKDLPPLAAQSDAHAQEVIDWGDNPAPADKPEEKAKTKTKTKGTRWEVGRVISPEWKNWAAHNTEHLTGADIEREAAQFVDHWLAATGSNAAKLDWLATWRKWIRTADQRRGLELERRAQFKPKAAANDTAPKMFEGYN